MIKIKKNVLLKDYTTFRIGGPADFFYEAKTEKNLISAIKTARKLRLPFFVLGRGSNILFDDQGFRGLVIRNLVSGAKIVRNIKTKKSAAKEDLSRARYQPADPKRYLRFADLDYEQESFDTEIEVFAGMPLQRFINWSLAKKLTGLQWFAGIPGSVGGAIVCNIHGGTKLFSDYVKEITFLDQNDHLQKMKKGRAGFQYDKSDFQKPRLRQGSGGLAKAIIVKATILLSQGDIERAKYVFKEWWQRKLKIQPQINCPGSIFKNFSKKTAEKTGSPTTGAGWFIDQCDLKGKIIGEAQISPLHANFIVNLGKATAEDVKKLIILAKKSVKNKFKLDLEEEIVVMPEKI